MIHILALQQLTVEKAERVECVSHTFSLTTSIETF